MSTTADPHTAATGIESPPRFIKWMFIVLLVIACIGALCQLAIAFWAQNELSQPESVVGIQSRMLARQGTLYYYLNQYPHTICAYTPIFYLIQAGLFRLGLPIVLGGRLISFAAMVGILSLIWRLLLLYTGSRSCAWTGLLLGAVTSLLSFWGTVAQVDTLATLWALAAFHQYSVYAIEGKNRLWWAAAFAVLAFFTKQTMLASPAAIFILLWMKRRKLGIWFGAALIGTIFLICVVLDVTLDGRFVSNTVFANLNPFAFWKLEIHARYAAVALGQLVLIAATGFRRVLAGMGRELFLYVALAATELVLMAPKIGSDSNYQMEASVVLVLCACISLHNLNFFGLTSVGSRAWITLLQLPLALHFLLNLRITVPVLIGRVYTERHFRTQVDGLRPYLSDGGRVISTDINAMLNLDQRLEVEPLIYSLLVNAGRSNPEPARHDIAAELFSTILLYEDITPRDFASDNLEIPSLPGPLLDEVKTHYKLVDRIDGPYVRGIYVYKRLSWVKPFKAERQPQLTPAPPQPLPSAGSSHAL